MGRRKRGYVNRGNSCGYKSSKIYDTKLIERGDRFCEDNNINWENLFYNSVVEYLDNHQNDDLVGKTNDELIALIKELRSDLYN